MEFKKGNFDLKTEHIGRFQNLKTDHLEGDADKKHIGLQENLMHENANYPFANAMQ